MVHHSRSNNTSVDSFLRLFGDAKRRREEREKRTSLSPQRECTFHPDIALSRHHPAESVAKSAKKTETLEWKHSPTIGRPPRIERNTASLPIGDYLYSKSIAMAELKVRRKEEGITRSIRTSSLVRQESRRLVENMKVHAYQRIFEMLDSDEDGLVTAKDADISCIYFPIVDCIVVPTDVLAIITPLLSEMEAVGRCMRSQDFVYALDLIYSRLAIPQKKVLLNIGRPPQKLDASLKVQQQFSFKVSQT